MKYYEVILKLINHGKDIGRICIQLRAVSPFNASVDAENILDGKYGIDIYRSTINVDEITEDEFLCQLVC